MSATEKEELLRKADISFRISLVLYLVLIIAQIAKVTWLQPPENSTALILAFSIIPLLLPAYGFIKRQPRSAAWLCFILCFYFTSSLLYVWFDITSINAWVMSAGSVTLFISAMMFTRWQGKANNLTN